MESITNMTPVWQCGHSRNDRPVSASKRSLYGVTGRNAEAEKASTEALAIQRELAARDPGAYRPDVAGTLNSLGLLYGVTGRNAEAEKASTEALALYRELVRAIPAHTAPMSPPR